MALRLFLAYVIVELAVVVALTSTIGFGWTILALLSTWLVGVSLAGSQLKKHLRRLQAGLTPAGVQGAAADSLLVALGTVLVVIPGLATSVAGSLLLLPPTRAVGRPLVAALAARRVPLVVAAGTGPNATGWGYDASGRGDYIDGEVIDVQPHRVVERKPE